MLHGSQCGKLRNEQVTFKNRDIYFNTGIQAMQCMGGNGEKDMSKNLQPMSIYYVHALNQFVTYGQGATDFHAKPQKERKYRAREPL